MVVAVSLMSVVLGAGLACAADHAQAYVVRLESWGGTFMIAGLGLLGSAMPLFR